MPIKDQYYYDNLLAHEDGPRIKKQRFPFITTGGLTLATMKPGYLVKFDATGETVEGAVAADDAVLAGVIADLALDIGNPNDTTVLVIMTGSLDQRTVKYADGTQPLSVAAIERLRAIQIYLEPSVLAPVPTP